VMRCDVGKISRNLKQPYPQLSLFRQIFRC